MTDLDPTQPYQPPAAVPPAAATHAEPPTADLRAGEVGASTAPVAVGGSRPGRSRTRWAIAAFLSMLIVGVVAGATLFLTGQSDDPDVLAWTPADRVSYVELRLDLPGSQQAEFAKILSAFPGFDDQSAFPAKIGEALDQLVREASDGKYDFQNDIDPWFGGELAVSFGPPPAGADMDVADASVLVLASVDDATQATTWVSGALTDAGATSTTEDYNGVTITIVTPPPGALSEDLDGLGELPVELPQDVELPPVAWAIVGPALAFGDLDSVKASIDTKGTGGLATNAQFATAEASVSDDRLAFVYLDASSALDAAASIPAELDEDGTLGALLRVVADLTPDWTALAVRAVDGVLVMDSRAPHVDAWGAPAPAPSALAGLVPSDTFFLTTGHSVGEGLATLRDLLAAQPELAAGVEELEDVLELIGGFDDATGWIGDLGVAVEPDGDGVVGGIVIIPTDAEAAQDLFDTLMAFIALGGGDLGLDVREEQYGGAEITIIDLGELAGDLAGEVEAGAMPLPDSIELAFTVTDEVVVIGLGSSFVRDVLDARDGPSLADDARFRALLERAGDEHTQLGWIDVTAMRTLIESAIPAAERAEYDTDVRPYLEPFDAVIGTMVPADDLDRGTVIIQVKE